MEQKLYIVVKRNDGEPWQEKVGGVFTERRLAENLIECSKANGFACKFAIVEGPINEI